MLDIETDRVVKQQTESMISLYYIHFWLLFQSYAVLLTYQFGLETNASIYADDDTVYNKSEFIKHYVIPEKPVEDNTLQNIFAKYSNNTRLRCHSPVLTLLYLDNTRGQYYFYVYSNGLLEDKFKDCWGFILEINTNKNRKNVFWNFQNQSDTCKEIFPVTENYSYEIKLMSLPLGQFSKINISSPTSCENRLLDLLPDRVNEIWKGCQDEPSLLQNLSICKALCSYYPNSTASQDYAMKHYVNQKNCRFVFLPTNQRRKRDEKSSQHILLIVGLTVIALILGALFITGALYCKRKRRRENDAILPMSKHTASYTIENENRECEKVTIASFK